MTIFINLKKFCASPHDDPREYLYEPWQSDAGYCATNGHIFIAVRETDDIVSVVEIPEKECPLKVESLAHLASKATMRGRSFRLFGAVLPSQTPCKVCKGFRYIEGDCSHCHRSESEACPRCCDGKELHSMQIGANIFNVEYIRLLAQIPECVLWDGGIAGEAAYFEFHGGHGVLQPLNAGKKHDIHYTDVNLEDHTEAAQP